MRRGPRVESMIERLMGHEAVSGLATPKPGR
jgi:hypothetical protein